MAGSDHHDAEDWRASLRFDGVGDERTGRDRRAADRRAPRRPCDPQFAATLLNQMRPQTEPAGAYKVRGYYARPGLVLNVRA